MKDLTLYIQERLKINKEFKNALRGNYWIPINIIPKDNVKDELKHESYETVQIVTNNRYEDLKKRGHTYGGTEIDHIDELGPASEDRDEALKYVHDYIRANKKNNRRPWDWVQIKRKSKIKMDGANTVVWCTSGGKMSPSGTSYWDWKLWDEYKDFDLYIGNNPRTFLIGFPGSLKKGDKIVCVDNVNQKTFYHSPKEIIAVSKCEIDDFRKTYKKIYPNYCRRPSKQFGKWSDGLPWKDFGQFYIIDGVSI